MSESQTVLPPLPSSVPSILGPVAVVVVPDLLTRENEPALGLWVPEERTIKLCAGVHPTTMLVTLWHERIHMTLWDCGAAPADSDEEERICDALSSMFFAELFPAISRGA